MDLRPLTTRCEWRRRELELRLFCDMRSGDGDRSSRVALYAGDRYPSSKSLEGAAVLSQEGFCSHCTAAVSGLDRKRGNARQCANSPRVGDSGSGSKSRAGDGGILYGSRVAGSSSLFGIRGDEASACWQSKNSSPDEGARMGLFGGLEDFSFLRSLTMAPSATFASLSSREFESWDSAYECREVGLT